MANLKAKDADNTTIFLKASGDGSEADPFVVEHFDEKVLNKLISIVQISNSIHSDLAQLVNKSVYERILVSDDLVVSNFYLDEQTANRRLDRVEYKSQALNKKITETYAYAFCNEDYYLVSTSRTSQVLVSNPEPED